jgi:hypothetical protein
VFNGNVTVPVTPLEAKDEVTVISFVETHGVTRVGEFAGGAAVQEHQRCFPY